MTPGLVERKALVLFTDEAGLAWLKVLKPGYRHCLACIELGTGWIVYNPMSHWTEISPVGPWQPGELAGWLARCGYTVVETRSRSPATTVAAWRPYTCVEAVKRVLGLHAPGVLTPWQLYRHLRRVGGSVTPPAPANAPLPNRGTQTQEDRGHPPALPSQYFPYAMKGV